MISEENQWYPTPPEDGVTSFGSMGRPMHLKHNDAGETPTGPRRFFASQLPPSTKQALESQLFLSVKIDDTLRDFAQGRRRRRFCSWDGPAERLSRTPHFREAFHPTSMDANFFRFVKEHEQGACRRSSSLGKGKGDTVDSDMLKLSPTWSTSAFFRDNSGNFRPLCRRTSGSSSELISGALNDFDSSDRWKRATRLLTERQDSVLRELKDTHVIEVRSLSGMEADQVWENATEGTA